MFDGRNGVKYRKTKNNKNICYATLTDLVYHIWHNRNFVLWNDDVKSPIQIIKQIQGDFMGDSIVVQNYSGLMRNK